MAARVTAALHEATSRARAARVKRAGFHFVAQTGI